MKKARCHVQFEKVPNFIQFTHCAIEPELEGALLEVLDGAVGKLGQVPVSVMRPTAAEWRLDGAEWVKATLPSVGKEINSIQQFADS